MSMDFLKSKKDGIFIIDSPDKLPKKDVDSILHLGRELDRVHNETVLVGDKDIYDYNTIDMESYCDEREVLVIYRSSGAIVGYIMVTPHTSSSRGIGYISELAVDKSHRRKGIGRMLLEYVLDNVLSMDRPITIAVHIDNVPAMKLYDSVGFETFGHRMKLKR